MSSTPTPGDPTTNFRIYWGRTLLALIGAVFLIGAGVSAALAVWGSMSWLVPGVCFAGLVVTMVILQITAAVRRRAHRRARVDRAFLEAMDASAEPEPARQAAVTALPKRVHTASAPFDALDTDPRGVGGPDSLMSVDEDGVPDDSARLPRLDAEVALFDQHQEATARPWEPREVPQPKYLVAEKAERSDPEPAQPEPEVSSDVKLREPAAPAAQPSGDRQAMNLDSVLARRRA